MYKNNHTVADDYTIVVIDARDTGSHFIRHLASMDQAMRSLRYHNFTVEVYDGDVISQFNIGRQAFNPISIGQNKAVNICSRVNNTYGFNYVAKPYDFVFSEMSTAARTIYVLCVDSVKFRKGFWSNAKRLSSYSMVLDVGNDAFFAQAYFMFTKKLLKNTYFLQYFEALRTLAASKSHVSVSCSHEESIKTQGFFVNAGIAVSAANMLWKFFMYNSEKVPIAVFQDFQNDRFTSVSVPVEISTDHQSPLI